MVKILYTTEYRRNKICGVWTRVRNESEWMKSHGHEIFICSSDDFGPKLRISDNTSLWHYSKLKEYILKIKPDIIICNTYRHLETHTCLNAAKELDIPCCLVTHAPFLEKGVRGKVLSAAAWLYDRLFCRLDEFSAVFTISKWEMPHLLRLMKNNEKIIYLPNALPDEFFKEMSPEKSLLNSNNKILFLGRIAPIKDVPTLLRALALSDKDYKLTLAGPFEKEYREFLVDGMEELNIQDQTCFTGSIDNIQDKIELINEHDIFILPSKREGMPQALLEAMALGRIVISSNTQGAKEIIEDGKNGFLFDIGDEKQLAYCIKQIELLKSTESKPGLLNRISENARQTAMKFAAGDIYPRTEQIYLELIDEKKRNNL